MSEQPSDDPLKGVLSRVRSAGEGEKISVGEILRAVGDGSFATALLVVSLVMVTPLSGIPTLPTIGALIIALIVVQWLVGRSHLWLPDWVMRRRIERARFDRGLSWLDKPAAFLDRHTQPRLTLLSHRPFRWLPQLAILGIVATWPFLELLPFFTTICAVGVALLAFGLMTFDGVWVLAGYVWVGALAAGAVALAGPLSASVLQ